MLRAYLIDGQVSIWHGHDRIVDPVPAPPLETGEVDWTLEDLGYWRRSTWQQATFGWSADLAVLGD